MPKINGSLKRKIEGEDYNSRLDNLQKAISVNSSQIVLAESKLLIRAAPPPSLGNYISSKVTSAYTNRSISTTKKDLKKGNSVDMFKNYYKNKRSKWLLK